MMRTPNLRIIKRDDWLVDACRNKRVLHIGCTDYPITKSKISNGKLLHPKLCEVAKNVIGVDIDKEGIELMSKLMPNQVFYVNSAENLEESVELQKHHFDIIVAADVLEHLSNIGLFLNGARSLLHPDGRLLITTPQAFAIKRMLAMIILSYEYVHPDHIAYFSISTLSRILSRYKFEIEEAYAFQWHNPTVVNYFANTMVLPALWLSRGRLCDELALVVK